MATSPRPPARAGADHWRRQRQFRRRRIVVAGALAAIIAIIVWATSASGSGSPHRRPVGLPARTAGPQDPPIPAVEAGVLPWSLHAAVSREAALPDGQGTILIAGGSSSAGAGTNLIASIDARTGNETAVGTLANPVREAPASVIAGQVMILGGASPAPSPAVEGLAAPPGAGLGDAPPPGWTTGSSPPGTSPVVITGESTLTSAANQIHPESVGTLPEARAEDGAVTVGSTTYLVGGYDGTNLTPQILSTSDGVHYRSVATLPVPVRFPAVSVLGSKIYIFGGEGAQGAAVDTVQVFDTGTGHISVSGQLASPLAGASAFTLQGHLYLAGGVTNATPTPTGGQAALSASATHAVWAWDPQTNRALAAGKLQVPVAFAGTAVTFGRAWLLGGETNGAPIASAQMVVPNPGFGTAGAAAAGSPYFGYKLLIADRGNDRLLVLSPGDQLVWTYPSVFAAAPPGGFYFPDDAFFAKGGTEIISNQERNHTIVIIAFPSGQLLWQYGHPLTEGSAPGYLSWPDDAYLLKDGEVTVADDRNCRILFISPEKTITSQIGATGKCSHQPPTGVAEPNGDTPLADGNYLVSEIQGQWISEYTKSDQLVWTTHLNIHYPSDPQQLGPDLYLVSDYAITPGGAIDEFNREGQILYRLQPSSGLARMNQPSLTELLPSGVFMTNDDYRDRMIAFDPPTGAVVWQYGVADKPGTAAGYLNTPDGFDLLAPDGSTPTHPATG